MGKLACLLAAISMAAAGMTACGSSDDSSETTTAATGGAEAATTTASGSTDGGSGAKGAKLAFLAPIQNGYIQAQIDAAKEAAGAQGATIETVLAADNDLRKQIGQIKDAVNSGKYDGLLVNPTAPQVAPAISAAVKAGVPVAVLGASLAEDPLEVKALPGVSTTATEDNSNIVAGLVELIKQACGSDPCPVGYIMGFKQFPGDVAILNGVKDGLKADSNIEIVATGEGQYQPGPARTAAADMLRAHPDIKVIAANADTMTQGAQLAAKAAGKNDLIYIGVGAGVQGCKAVEDGDWLGTVNLVPKDIGRVATDGLLKTLDDPSTVDQVIDPLKASGLGLTSVKGGGACPAQWNV